jgi:hypothetical protein
VTVEGVPSDGVRELQSWLLSEPGLQGRVSLIEQPPQADRLGPVLEGVKVLAESGIGAAFATMAVTWFKQQRSSVRMKIRGGHGKEIELDAKTVRLMDAAELRKLTEDLTRLAAEDHSMPPEDAASR